MRLVTFRPHKVRSKGRRGDDPACAWGGVRGEGLSASVSPFVTSRGIAHLCVRCVAWRCDFTHVLAGRTLASHEAKTEPPFTAVPKPKELRDK